jgi:hypothetical protein
LEIFYQDENAGSLTLEIAESWTGGSEGIGVSAHDEIGLHPIIRAGIAAGLVGFGNEIEDTVQGGSAE